MLLACQTQGPFPLKVGQIIWDVSGLVVLHEIQMSKLLDTHV